MTGPGPDLLDTVRRGATPAASALRGLGGQWKAAEQAIAQAIRSDPRTAARWIERYERLARACGEREALGRAARLRGSRLHYVGEHSKAVPCYRRAIRLLDGAARDGARLGLAASLAQSGRFQESARSCGLAARDAGRRGDRQIAAAAELNRGLALHEAGASNAAAASFRRAHAGFVALEDGRGAALALQNLANELVLLDRFEEAESSLAEAAASFERLGLTHESLRNRYNRGCLLVAIDRLGDADRELAELERDFLRAGDPQHAALARLDRGEALLRAGLVAEASRALDSAARSLRRGVPPSEAVRAAMLRARAAIGRGAFAQARSILRAVPARPAAAWQGDVAELHGLALAGVRKFAEARRSLESAAKAFGPRRPSARSRAICAAGWCAAEAGDLTAARRLAVRAERLARGLPIPSLVCGAAALRFVVEDESENRQAASAALRRALAALERTREGLGADPMRSAVLRGRERWFARAVRHLLGGRDGEAAALALIERWRARALVDLLSSSARIETGGGRLAALRARVAAIEVRLEGATTAPYLRTQRAQAAPQLARRLAIAERRLFEEASGGDVESAGAALAPPALARRVPAGTALVSLFADERGGVAFVLRDGRIVTVPLPVRESELRSLVEELYFRLGKFTLGAEFVAGHRRRLTSETDRILGALAARTVEPLAAALAGVRRVVIAPHGAWHQVPFAALAFGDGRFGDAFAVAMAPALAALSPDVATARGRPVVLALPDPRAPTIAEEGRAVAATAADAEHLEGDAAVSDALRGREPPRFVHVASHGRFRADVPGMSGVRLADGWLRAVDFGSLDLTGSLVVLSGCETGVSHVDAGGEVHGLVRGVMASGAAELVVSLWRVDDAATARLMSRFHALRASEPSVEAALAAAQREAASSGLHPWYWAGFTAWTRRL